MLVELDTIRLLIRQGAIVVCVGGGVLLVDRKAGGPARSSGG
jgi:carbamate kinase